MNALSCSSDMGYVPIHHLQQWFNKNPAHGGERFSIEADKSPHFKRSLLGMPGSDGHRSSFSRQTGVTGCSHEGWDCQLVDGNFAGSFTGLPRRHWDYLGTSGFRFHE